MGAEVNGDYLHYIARGEGQPVILIHGMAASLHDWEALVPEYAMLRDADVVPRERLGEKCASFFASRNSGVLKGL